MESVEQVSAGHHGRRSVGFPVPQGSFTATEPS
jgi:hypothetical protein